jgi:hypothetical protein
MTYATMFKSGGNSENLRRTFNDLRTLVLAIATGNICNTPPGLQLGTSSAKAVRAGTAFTATVLGMPYTNAVSETAFTATTHDIADGYKRYFRVEVPAGTNGTVILTPGTAVLAASTAVVPDATAAHATLGTVLIEADGAIFNASTDDLNASHLTVTYTDWDYAAYNAAQTPVPGFQLTEN